MVEVMQTDAVGHDLPPGTVEPFTSFQWYLSKSRNAVYFAGYSPLALSRDEFRELTGKILGLAPQLHLRNDDLAQAHLDARPFALDDIIAYSEVDNFNGLPDRAVMPTDDLFVDPVLPSFRAACFTLRNGTTTTDGNRSLIVFRSSHALMEGIDTANVVRGRPSKHIAAPPKTRPRPLGQLTTWAIAALAVPTNFLLTATNWRDKSAPTIKSAAFSRRDIRDLSAELGVQQRSLIFALIMYAFYYPEGRGVWRPRVIGYTNLTAQRFDGDDRVVKLRMQTATLRGRPDFRDYVTALDARLKETGRERLGLQMHYNAIFAIHKRIARWAPGLYGRRFFSFAPFDFLLSLLPPHSPGGALSYLKTNSVYCGTYAPGTNCCVIVPQPDRFTLNFYGPRRMLERVSAIQELAAAAGVSMLDPPDVGPEALAATSARSPAEA